MIKPPIKIYLQTGQTLIETVVAVFILVMGITAALGLAIYALNASGNVSKQIIGIGLARQGLEAVRNMRDTNWLGSTLNTDCYNYVDGSNTGLCYKTWLSVNGCGGNGNDKGYCISPAGGNASYRLGLFSNASQKNWSLQSATNNWGLDLDTGITNFSFKGFYVPNTLQSDGSSDYYRKITLQTVTSQPFDQADLGPKLLVKSQVWWVDKKCPRSQAQDWPGAGKCSIELDSYLTNWKNY